MSIQLTLYPQYEEGVYSWTYGYDTSNKVANPTWAYPLLANYSSNAPNPAAHSMFQNAPMPAWNTWITSLWIYHTVTAPNIFGNPPRLRLHSYLTSKTGVYQDVHNLVAGITYNYNISLALTGLGTITVGTVGYTGPFTVGGTQYYGTPVDTHVMTSVVYGFSLSGSFVAQGTTTVLQIQYEGDGVANDTILIDSISVLQDSGSLYITNVDDGQVVVDLYDHAPIPMTLSVDDFKNIAEKPQSYSKAFNLPATKHNNKIFTSAFDFTSSQHQNPTAFNPYMVTKAVLKEDGNTIFEGHLKLIDMKQVDGETTYTVNLFSTAVSLKSLLGNKTLNDLDGGATGGGAGLSELLHIHTKASIKPSWIGLLPLTNAVPAGYTGYLTGQTGYHTGGETTTNVLKYPFVQWNGGITQEQGGSQNGWPELNHMSNAFRPFIKLKYLVDRIIGEAGFSYQSDFMEGIGNALNPEGYSNSVRKYPDFERLFMDFNWGANTSAGSFGTTLEMTYKKDNDTSNNHIHPAFTWKNIRFTDGEQALEQFGWHSTNHEFTVPYDNWQYSIGYTVTFNNSASAGTSARWHLTLMRENSAGVWQEDLSGHWNITGVSGGGTTTKSGSGSTTAQAGDVIKLRAYKWQPNPGSASDVIQGNPADTSAVTATITCSVDPLNMSSDIMLLKRGKIKQWDILKDLITMFNLVILQDKSDASMLKIEPYDDIFIDNENTTNIDQATHDWTTKVDVSGFEYKPLKLKKDVVFTHKEDKKDYAHGVYLDATGDPFGDFGVTTNASVATGEQKVSMKVFASTFTKPLFTGFAQSFTVPQIVNQKSDGSIIGFDNKPRILYDIAGDHSNYNNLPQLPNINGVQKTYRMPSFNGVTGEQQSRFCQFSHVSGIPINNAQRDFNFGSMQLIGGGSTPRNIFNEYWAPYYDELYHSDTMTVKIKVMLSPQEMSVVNFYDKIFIKNREYRINKIDYKAGALSTCELILMP